MGISWDDIVQPLATIDAIDPAAMDFLQRSAISHGRMMESDYSSDVKTVLESLDLIDEEGHLRNAAILLFGKRPSRYFTLCDFRIGRFIKDETDLIFQDVIEGDLIRMADRVISVLRSKYLTTPIHYEGLGRFEPLEIPEKALREAIFNAIIHKDYSGVHIQMKVYNDRIELWNQGSLPSGWTVEKMLAYIRLNHATSISLQLSTKPASLRVGDAVSAKSLTASSLQDFLHQPLTSIAADYW